mmetsp:Transcript_16370/g.22620  ORF Transcript_16370/g.22620 Transcript_16370/m.22620 type:complete len:464 (-) Transcript_16370:309-1700(-)|eukprot:CAMPEP_0196585840 /NCGR_PEP_ID=MMETSP1081-20130531/52222_1 /TAXON_ID=36882 /ORGANISM="Pyramimonas amylifera, Strain CCMP720" /LENGTH=463 /DNA_ID=CAMNT_0041907525 /DNA_START=101 /DNA_END=1492 /DNA_ORIENTATION=+
MSILTRNVAGVGFKRSLSALQARLMSTQTEHAKLILPDGTEAKLPLLNPSFGTDKFLDIQTLNKQTGLFTFDPGFTATGSCNSSITFIDGAKGLCAYRGIPVQDLAENSHFLETSYLLLQGELPNKTEMEDFEEEIRKHMLLKQDLIRFFDFFPTNAHPMAQMTAVVGGLSAFYPVSLNPKDVVQHKEAAVRLIAKMPMIAGLIYRDGLSLPVVYPDAEKSYAENLLYLMFANPIYKKYPHKGDKEVFKAVVKAVDAFLILHADHEQNASTSTVRIAGSSQANPYACVAAGVASLWGPAHGGANEAVIDMLAEIGTKDKVAEFVRKVKAKEEGVRLMGFGHRVYKNYDPRAKYFRGLVQDVLLALDCKDPSLEVAKELERIALEDEYFIQRKLYPNVDFYTGIMLRALGIPTNMFTVLFALARTTGWVAQWAEMVEDPDFRISRPRQIYTGAPERPYVPMASR